MKFQLSKIVALLLLFLTGHSLAYNACYTGGMKWSDLGTESEVDGALSGLCNMFEGAKAIHSTVCQTIMALNAAILYGKTS